MITQIKRGMETVFLVLVALLPPRLMTHLLFLLHNRPDLTDLWSYHIRPIHYYEPLPDFRRVDPKQLARRRESPAIDFRIKEQRALLHRPGANYRTEIAELACKPAPAGFDFDNPYFSGLDAAQYYALIRDLRPTLVVEVGSGYSTQIASKALERNARDENPGRLVAIEPYSEPRLTESDAKFELINARDRIFRFDSSINSPPTTS